jgi:hypothetical protein
MNPLENIPKKQIFEVPEGYFERLPQVVQSRTTQVQHSPGMPYLRIAVRYALPLVLLGASLWFWLMPAQKQSAESLLADIHTEELIRYLVETDMELDDILLTTELENLAADGVEDEVYSLFQEEYHTDEDLLNQL